MKSRCRANEFQLSLLFSDHNLSVQTLENFGTVIKLISSAFPDGEDRSTAFLKYVSDHHPSLVSASLPKEVDRRLGNVMSRLRLPVFELEKTGDFTDDSSDRPVTSGHQSKLKRKVSIIAVIFRWMGVLFLIGGAIGFITFLGNEKLWTEVTVLMAGIGLAVFVPYFLVTWSFLRSGVRLTRFEPRARRDAIMASIGGLVLVSLWGLRSFWTSALFGGHNPLIVITVWVLMTSLFVWTLIVLCSKIAQVAFAGGPYSADPGSDASLAPGMEKLEPVSGGSEMGPVSPDTQDSTLPMTRSSSGTKIPRSLSTAENGPMPGANVQNPQKPKISGRAVIKDIEIELDDMALMQKYGLSAKQLVSLYQKLEAAGLMKKQ